MLYRGGMLDLRGKAEILQAIATRVELTELERTVILEAAARFLTDAAAEGSPSVSMAEPPRTRVTAAGGTDAVLFSDGASRGNPGPAGIGAVLEAADGHRLAEIAEYIGHTTNNVAEYRALLAGLERALALGVVRLEVRADSELMIKQLRGDYQVKNARLVPLYREARRLLGRFERVELKHVRRELNTRADELANAGIDSAR
jgi:ribonuclease HI